MGGYGSGRTARKMKAESCRALEVNHMKRQGSLQAGCSGNWTWSREGEVVAQIGFRTDERQIVLDYRVRQYGDDWEAVTQYIPLLRVACNFGGQRTYFGCPGIVNGQPCGRRVGKLLAGGRYFLCRHCYSVAYGSQSEDRHDRMLRRANKLRMALGGEPGTAHFIASKPKGMWWRTYNRKRVEIGWCEDQATRAFIHKYSQLLSLEDSAKLFEAGTE